MSRQCLVLLLAAAAHQVAAFGSVDLGDQEFEHERITRSALQCPDGEKASIPFDCFEPISMDMVAGTRTTAGAVGAPDVDEIFNSESHCDNADFLDLAAIGLQGTYARSREQATGALFDCVNHLRNRISQGIDAAEDMLGDDGLPRRDEVDIEDIPCIFAGAVQGRSKCNTIEGFGRALHGVQDFFAHSNWVDVADSTQDLSVANPPGLSLTDRPPFLALADQTLDLQSIDIPRDLSTGCFIFSVLDPIDGARDCEAEGRITHETLNKDNGLVNVIPSADIVPETTLTDDPKTPRGQIADNFDRAVRGAIEETRRQWDDFREALKERYGEEAGLRMIRTLVADRPWEGDVEADDNGVGRLNVAYYSYSLVVIAFAFFFM